MTKYTLTAEHRTQLKPWADRWIKNALSTDAMTDEDRRITAEAIRGIYAAAGLAAPRIVFVPSPIMGAFVAGFAAWIWHCRKSKPPEDAIGDATMAATWDETWGRTHDAISGATTRAAWVETSDAIEDAVDRVAERATAEATVDAIEDATWDAIYGAISETTKRAVTYATRAATDLATWDATERGTWDATWDATKAATAEATYDATERATREATVDATRDTIRAATVSAARDATERVATYATRAATAYAISDATWNEAHYATSEAVMGATYDAERTTEDATWDAVYEATNATTNNATRAATEDATTRATRRKATGATADETRAATKDATNNATADAVERATWDATWGATKAATLDEWYNFPCDVHSVANALGVGAAGIKCAAYASRLYQGGNQRSGGVAFYSFFRHIAKLSIDYSKWKHWETAALHSGPRYVHEKFCIVSDRPEVLTTDAGHRPHNETGPFCRWRDGTALYAWHGVCVPGSWIEDKESLDPRLALTHQNIEERRAIAEIVGWEKVLGQLDAKHVSTDEYGTLLEVDLPDSGRERFVKVTCGTGRQFVLPVPKEMKTPRQAVAWTYGLDDEETYNVEVRT